MKILMALMGMEIGGAETHVLELATDLKNKGYDVIVTSNGGVYVKELEDVGIKHIKLPLHTKKPSAMIKSFFGLKKIIKEEKPDIVHSHARIPSFILGLLNKFVRFNFVTSAHWVFNTSGILKYITTWGSRSVAVSEDIKKYLPDAVYCGTFEKVAEYIKANAVSGDMVITMGAGDIYKVKDLLV